MTNKTKKISKFELFCIVYKCLDIKIQNHTLPDFFESVNADVERPLHMLSIHFKNRNYYFSLDANRLYKIYENSNYDFSATVKTLIGLAQKQYDEIENISSESHVSEEILDIRNIYVQVMPYDAEYFTGKLSIPLPFDDKLHAMFRCYVGHGENGIISIPITQEIYDLHFSSYAPEELLEIAKKTTRQLFPFQKTRISHALEMDLSQRGYSPEEIKNCLSQKSKHDFLYRITTNVNHYGANVFLFPELLREFAQEIGSSFYILPGSVREVYFVSVQNAVKDDWLSTIKAANTVAPEEFLSEHLYHYNINSGTVSIYK